MDGTQYRKIAPLGRPRVGNPPHYLGVDEQGDRVWELADGRWTWGKTAQEALQRTRTLEPERYVEKYGAPHAEHLWPCGCLRNDGGAHRVGCPEHPEGVRGSRL